MSRVYYNENDERAAGWLRALINAGAIPDGEVDTRSIVDVRPADLIGFRQCHFFAGIGGWAYALRLAGWPDDRECWTGSCPCQPWSVAGAGEGTDDPRHLWPAWFPLIRERRPSSIFGEQTSSLDGRYWLDLVLADLEGIEYAVGAFDLPAASVGAPHGRARLWLVADDNHGGRGRLETSRLHERRPGAGGRETAAGDADGAQRDDALRRGGSGVLADAASGNGAGAAGGQARAGRAPQGGGQVEGRRVVQSGNDGDARGGMADAVRDGAREHARELSGDEGEYDERAALGGDASVAGGATRDMVDAGGAGLEGFAGDGDNGDQSGRLDAGPNGSTATAGAARGGVADTGLERRAEYEHDARGRQAGATANAAIGRWSSFWSDCDWIPCIDGKARPVEPGSFPLADGVPARVGRLRGYGNAIVPQVAAAVIAAYMDARGIKGEG